MGLYIKNYARYKTNINYIPYIYKLNNYKFTTYSINIINNYNKDINFEILPDKINEISDTIDKILLEKEKFVFVQLQSLFTVNLHLFIYNKDTNKYTIYIYDSYVKNPKHYQRYVDIYKKKNVNIISKSLPTICMLERYNNLLSGKEYEFIEDFINDMLKLLFKPNDIYYYVLTNDINSVKKYNRKIIIPYILLYIVYDNKMLKHIYDKIENKIFVMEQKKLIKNNDIQEYVKYNNKNKFLSFCQ
jgi:hypothetical protein